MCIHALAAKTSHLSETKDNNNNVYSMCIQTLAANTSQNVYSMTMPHSTVGVACFCQITIFSIFM